MMKSSRVALLAALAWPLSGCDTADKSPLSPLTPLGQISFATRTQLQSGLSAIQDAVHADLDSDGRPDFAAVDVAGNLNVRLGQNGGGFAQVATLPAPTDATYLRAADLDGDGVPELVAIAAISGQTQVYRNDGFANFTADPIFSAGSNVLDAVLADLDGDSTLDLVLTRYGAAGVDFYGGVGDGTFGGLTVVPFTRGLLVGALSLGDLDGDGGLDLVFADFDSMQLRLLRTDGALTITSQDAVPLQGGPFSTQMADVDGDGRDEVAVADLSAEQVVIVGGAPSQILQTIDVQGEPVDLAVGDFTPSAGVDLAVALIDRRTVALVDGLGASSPSGLPFDSQVARMIPTSGNPNHIESLDADADGDDDLFVVSMGAEVADLFFNDSSNLVGADVIPVSTFEDVEILAVGQFDLRSRLFLVTADIGRPAITFVSPTNPSVQLSVPTRPIADVQAVDIDGNPLTDLLLSVDGGVQVWRNSSPIPLPTAGLPTGGFTTPTFENVSGPDGFVIEAVGAFEAAVADVNGDDTLDVVAAFPTQDLVAVALGIPGQRTFENPVFRALSGTPSDIDVGDFDGDGRSEIVVTRLDADLLTRLEYVNGNLELISNIGVAAGPTFVEVADLDLDGQDDLVLAESNAGMVSVLTDDGQGGFTIRSFGAGDFPTALIVRDLDRDGRPDLVSASLRSPDFRVFRGDGQGGFSDALVFPGLRLALTADLFDANGDGLEDLFVGGFESGGFAIIRNASVEAASVVATAQAVFEVSRFSR